MNSGTLCHRPTCICTLTQLIELFNAIPRKIQEFSFMELDSWILKFREESKEPEQPFVKMNKIGFND